MNEKERIFILIDGNNFYHRLKELKLNNLLSFHYEKLSDFLTGQRLLIFKHYYIGAIREEQGNPKSKELMRGQRKLTSILQRDGWIVKFGHMLKTDGYHEKGVDVQIAVDLLIGAYENLYDTALIISGDEDFVLAIRKVQKLGKKVENIYFCTTSSNYLKKTCNSSFCIDKKIAKSIELK